MKQTLVYIFFLFYFAISAQAQIVQNNDTLYLNYFIASGEFGGTNEGLVIHNNGDNLMAKSIRYNNNSYGKSLEVDTIVNFYKENCNNYTEIKTEWVLNKKECDYLVRVLDEIKAQSEEENVYSNASEHYTILSKCKSHVFIDRTGKWNKFLEVKRALNIDLELLPLCEH